jgi:chitin disaccharide deacetylase
MEPAKIKLIVNADDLGFDHPTNLAIVRAFEMRLCSSCTLMANMPAFEEACDLVHECGLAAHTGLHLTLTEGSPVTEDIRACPRFCDEEGRFCLSRRQRVFHLSANERQALAEEIAGQIDACRQRGILLTHVDAHKHVHEEWAITSLLITIVREMKIPYVRLCKTFGFGISRAKRWYRKAVNLRLRTAGLAGTDYFGAPDDYMLYCWTFGSTRKAGASWEVMVHPTLSADGKLVDAWLKRPVDDMVRALAGYEQASSYAGCRYRVGSQGHVLTTAGSEVGSDQKLVARGLSGSILIVARDSAADPKTSRESLEAGR